MIFEQLNPHFFDKQLRKLCQSEDYPRVHTLYRISIFRTTNVNGSVNDPSYFDLTCAARINFPLLSLGCSADSLQREATTGATVTAANESSNRFQRCVSSINPRRRSFGSSCCLCTLGSSALSVSILSKLRS